MINVAFSTLAAVTEKSRVPISAQFQQTGVMAILRAGSSQRFLDVSRVLVDAGITCLEVTLTSPGALDAIGEIRAELPDEVDVGAGTVLTPDDVRDTVTAGAAFVVSPSAELDVVAAAREAGIGSYPGAFSTTEVLAAWRAGASAVKLFPAAAVGPSYLKQLAGPLPDVPILPTGGVAIDQIRPWIKAGAIGVGLGGPLLADAADGGDLDALAERAKQALSEVAMARQESA